MKKIYLLNTYWMNGVHKNEMDKTAFTSKALAEKTKAAVDKANGNSDLEVVCDMTEIDLFEDESEVPILNAQPEHLPLKED